MCVCVPKSLTTHTRADMGMMRGVGKCVYISFTFPFFSGSYLQVSESLFPKKREEKLGVIINSDSTSKPVLSQHIIHGALFGYAIYPGDPALHGLVKGCFHLTGSYNYLLLAYLSHARTSLCIYTLLQALSTPIPL